MDPQGALVFLLNIAIELYTFVVLTRFVMQLVRADFYNPISQFVVRATNPILAPLRKLIPGWGTVDVASLILVLVLIVAKICLMTYIVYGGFPAILSLILFSVRELASLLLNFVFYTVIIRVVLSWIAPDPFNPFTAIMIQLTEPVMAPARRLLPPLGGLDLSPLIVLLLIQFLQILFRL